MSQYVFPLPEIGEGVVEGEIVGWKVKPGDMVATDQPLCEIMTDKATVEISSPKSGKVLRVHGKPGDVVKVHSPLVELDLAGTAAVPAEAAPAPRAEAPRPAAPVAAPAAPVAAAPKPAAPAVSAMGGEGGGWISGGIAGPVAVAAVSGGVAGGGSPPPPAPAPAGVHPAVAAKRPPPPGYKAVASPAVRAAARGVGVDINEVVGTGKAGRVTRSDIEAFVAHPEAVVAPPALPAPTPTEGDERVRIIGLRRKIAEKMVESYHTVPHFTYVDEVDCTRLAALRESLNERAQARGVKLSYLPFIMKALALVFREFPTVNAVMDEAEFTLVVRKEINIGIATDSPAGLYVPVVRNVDRKTLLELAAEVADLSQRTREGKVALSELQGGTFTITSVGNIGGRFATPIINHPEVAILGVNQIHDRPMVVDGQICIRKMMYLSPSFDHRVIDGAVGARFVSALKAILEAPESLLLDLR